MRLSPSLLLPLVILFLAVNSASAITLSARVGFDGYFVPGRWTPVVVTVENLPRADKRNDAPADFTGAVRILSRGVAGESGPMLFTRELDVPANDRKRLILYARFAAGGGDIEVELVNRGKRRVQVIRVNRKPVEPGQPLVAWFRTTDSAISLPKIADLPGAQIASIEPGEVPDRWYGYDGATLVIVPRMLDKLLDRDQAQALRLWVAQGGRLLLVGGRHGSSYQGSPLEDLLPGPMTGSASFSLTENGLSPALEGEAGATSSPLVQISALERTTSTTVYLASQGVPLLLGKPHGAGEVLYLTSDWSPRLFARFPVPKLLTTYVLTVPAFTQAASRLDTVFPFGDAGIYGLGKASALPDPGLVAIILLSYLVIVGPANFYLLARRKRLELAWLTVPVIVAVFCGLIYGLGSYIRGSSSFFRNYHLITGRTGSEIARCETLALTYVPENRRETISLDGGAAAGHTIWADPDKRLFPGLSGGASTGGDLVPIAQEPQGMALREKLVRQWAYDLSRFDSVMTLNGAVDGKVSLKGTTATVAVRNSTDQPIEDLHLVISGQAWRLGGGGGEQAAVLQPGESLNRSILLSRGGKGLSDITGSAAGNELDQLVFDAFAATLAAGDPLKPDLPPCFLVGRLSKAPVPVRITGSVGVRSDHSFLALAIPVQLLDQQEPVEVAVPSRLLGDSGGFFGMGRSGTVVIGSAPVCFAATLPSAPWTVAAAEAELQWGPWKSGNVPFTCDIFDFETWQWRETAVRNMPRNTPARTVEDEESRGVVLDNELGLATMTADGIRSPVHPLTGAMLIRISHAKEPDQQGGLFVAPPLVRKFSSGSFPRSSPL